MNKEVQFGRQAQGVKRSALQDMLVEASRPGFIGTLPAYYNFCKIHQSLRVTPAMEAGITDHIWTSAAGLGNCCSATFYWDITCRYQC